MRITLNMLAVLAVGGWCAHAGAEGIWAWTHEASGSGTANVFDGGPPVFREDQTFGPDDDRMSFSAGDSTRPGSLGAGALAAGRSHVIDATEELFRFRVDLVAGYFPSFLPGGDNPGGEAEAELFSVIEFTMPVDELVWLYQLLIDETGLFHGETGILVQNVTQEETLLELSSEVLSVETTLTGQAGDVIRITSNISGAGSMAPGTGREYESNMEMFFIVPEPGTLVFLLFAVPLARKKGRRA